MNLSRYKIWLIAIAILVGADLLGEASADDLDFSGPKFYQQFLISGVAPALVLLTFPIWLPRLYFFYIAGKFLGINLILDRAYHNEWIVSFSNFMGDLFVLFIYFILYKIAHIIWITSKKNFRKNR